MSEQTDRSGATFVFVGVVRRIGASHMPEAPSSDATAVVGVEQVMMSPPTFADTTGEVTVLLPDGIQVEVDQRLTFWCVGWVVGTGLAVRALEVTAPSEAAAEATAARGDPTTRLEDERLVGRVGRSELIVSGFVSDVRSVAATPTAPGETTRVSEHDPDWHEAVVEVESVSKGTPPEQGVVVVFPLSRDVSWYTAPKFAVGERGVWLLRSTDTSDVPAEHAAALRERPRPSYTALDPLDFQPDADADAVASLAERDQS